MLDRHSEAENVANQAVNTLKWPTLEHGTHADIAELIHGIAWRCFEAGWERSKEAHDVTTTFLQNELYRKGVIAAFDGMEFTYGGSTYVNIKNKDGQTTEFSLRNLPDHKHLERFSMLPIHLKSDSTIQALADQNTELAKALELISSVVEKTYWRKVAASLKRYHAEASCKIKARETLLSAGFTADEVEGLIPEPTVDID